MYFYKNIYKKILICLFFLMTICSCSNNHHNLNLDHIIIPVIINDHEYNFILDTGSSFTTLDSKLLLNHKNLLNKKEYYYSFINGSTKTTKIPIYGPINITALGQEFRNIKIADLKNATRFYSAIFGIEPDGILGMDAIEQYVWVISNNRANNLNIKIFPINNYKIPREYNCIDNIYRREIKGGIISATVPIKIIKTKKNIISEDFILDTGADTSEITGELIDNISKIDTKIVAKDKIKNVTVLNKKVLYKDRLLMKNIIKLNDISINNITFIKGDFNLVGLNIIKRFKSFILTPENNGSFCYTQYKDNDE